MTKVRWRRQQAGELLKPQQKRKTGGNEVKKRVRKGGLRDGCSESGQTDEGESLRGGRRMRRRGWWHRLGSRRRKKGL